jgi:hypothetical protein
MPTFHTSQILLVDQNSALLEPEVKAAVIKQVIFDYLEKQKFSVPLANITFFNEAFANFPIEEVRLMQTAAEYSPSFSGKGQRAFILLNFESAGTPAQNAALKILEESPAQTLILLPVYELGSILPTIISRCQLVSLAKEEQTPITSDFTWPKTLAEAITLTEQYKDRNQALSLVGGLLRQSEQNSSTKRLFLEAYQALRRNQNVQLTLENCFFSLVKLQTSL